MGEIIPLPSAALSKVRQPMARGSWKAALAEAREAGIYVRHPSQFLSPGYRRHYAEQSEREELFRAAGIARSGPTMLAAIALAVLSPEQQQRALSMLRGLAHDRPDPAIEGALLYAESIIGRSSSDAADS